MGTSKFRIFQIWILKEKNSTLRFFPISETEIKFCSAHKRAHIAIIGKQKLYDLNTKNDVYSWPSKAMGFDNFFVLLNFIL